MRSNLMPARSSLFSDFFDDQFWSDGFNGGSINVPAVNVKDEKEAFTLELAAPGKKKEDFKIDVDHNVLTISSENREESSDEQDNYTRKEFSYQAFSRSFGLPDAVIADKIKANYNDGVLTVKLPKTTEARETFKKEIIVG